jgi:hypothetical protein
MIESIKKFFDKYERHISSAALIIGFVIDSLTLRRIDFLLENLVIISYLLIAGIGIIILNLYEGNIVRGKFFEWMHRLLPTVIQFAFGGLFSAFLVFYFRSASFASAWPFVIILVGLLLGNELFKKYYQRMAFHLSIYFFSIFLFSIFYVPIFLGTMGDWVFVVSGLVSLALMSAFIFLLFTWVPERIRAGKRTFIWSIGSIFVVMNLLYFTNIIPPIPLSLKNIGVYYDISRVASGYRAVQERQEKSFFDFSNTVHVIRGNPVYVFSAVFAPTTLSTTVVHHWQYYDEKKEDWVTATRSAFPIIGGRDGGYRGYSWKTAITPGLWRVNVETPRGQLIGRVKFRVEQVSEPPQVEAIIL